LVSLNQTNFGAKRLYAVYVSTVSRRKSSDNKLFIVFDEMMLTSCRFNRQKHDAFTL